MSYLNKDGLTYLWSKITNKLSGYVKNTDYATTSSAGVIKVGKGLYINTSTGYMYPNAAPNVEIDKESDPNRLIAPTNIPRMMSNYGIDKTTIPTIQSKVEDNRVTLGYSGKNLLKNEGVSQTKNEVIFTVNSDNSVTCVGTATASTTFQLSSLPYKSISDFPDKTILSGGTSKIDVGLQVNRYRESGGYIRAFVSTDSDTECDFTNYKQYFAMFYVNIKEGVTVNETVYPMLRPASITDDTYEPYIPSVDERLKALEAAILG